MPRGRRETPAVNWPPIAPSRYDPAVLRAFWVGLLPAALLMPEAADYGAPIAAAAPDRFEREALRAFPGCREDRRLTLTAREIARGLAELGDATALEPSRATFLARRVGVVDAALVASAVAAPGSLRAAASGLRAAQSWDERAPTHCGAGVSGRGEGRVLALVTTRRLVEIEPFPSRPDVGAEHVLSGRVSEGVRSPRVLMTPPDGDPIGLPLVVAGRTFHAAVSVPEAGEYRLEVMVEGPSGPEAAAILPLWAGVPPPTRPVVTLAPEPGRPSSEGTACALLRLLERTRAAAGLPRLRPQPMLARMARERAERMRDEGFVGHRSPVSGDLTDEFRRFGLSSRRVAENVGRGGSAARVHENFLASPAHRAAVLDPEMTDVGVGVAVLTTSPPSIVAVEVFAADPSSATQ